MAKNTKKAPSKIEVKSVDKALEKEYRDVTSERPAVIVTTKDELKQFVPPPRTPESVYGIDSACVDLPRLLRAILTEIMR